MLSVLEGQRWSNNWDFLSLTSMISLVNIIMDSSFWSLGAVPTNFQELV